MENREWIEARCGKFTASEIYKLLVSAKGKKEEFGKTAMSYIMTKVAENLTGESEVISGRAIEWGIYHEGFAITLYRQRINKDTEYFGIDNPVFYTWTEFSGGSPDALTDSHLIEVKCPYVSVHHIENMLMDEESFKSERSEYYAQMQFNMLITKRGKGHFVSYDPRIASPDHQLFVLEVSADVEFQNNLIERISLAEDRMKQIIKKLINLES